MKEKNSVEVSERPSGKMVLYVISSLIVILVLLYFTAVSKNRVISYIFLLVYLFLGVVMVFRYKVVGSAIYRANLTILSWVWRHIFKLSEEKVLQRIIKFKALPVYGYTYHLVITFIIGLGLIAGSIWLFIMILQNRFF
jgi:hypothetical protein